MGLHELLYTLYKKLASATALQNLAEAEHREPVAMLWFKSVGVPISKFGVSYWCYNPIQIQGAASCVEEPCVDACFDVIGKIDERVVDYLRHEPFVEFNAKIQGESFNLKGQPWRIVEIPGAESITFRFYDEVPYSYCE